MFYSNDKATQLGVWLTGADMRFFEQNKREKNRRDREQKKFEEFRALFKKLLPKGYTLFIYEDYEGRIQKNDEGLCYFFTSEYCKSMTSKRDLENNIGLVVKQLETGIIE